MRAHWVRVVDDDGPTGWVGLFVSRNMVDLFWLVDRHVSPHDVEIFPAESGSILVDFDLADDDGEIDDEVEIDDVYDCSVESNHVPRMGAPGWRRPRWPASVWSVFKGKK